LAGYLPVKVIAWKGKLVPIADIVADPSDLEERLLPGENAEVLDDQVGAEQPLHLAVDVVLPLSYPAVEVRAIRIQACHASYEEEEQPQWMLRPTTP